MNEDCEVCGRYGCIVQMQGVVVIDEMEIECWRLGFKRLKAENASLLESLREARAAATVHFEEAGKLAEWKAKAMPRLIELEPVHDELEAAEQRNTALEAENLRLKDDLAEMKADLDYVFGLLPNHVPRARPGKLTASSRCPICGTDFPHQHTYEEEYKHRVRFARKHAPPAKSKYREWANAALHGEER